VKTSGQSKSEAKALAKQLEIVGDAQVKISELQAKARKILEQSKLTFEKEKTQLELMRMRKLKELEIKKAKEIEVKRDGYLEQYHAYEFASLLIQLGIVLASVTLLTSIMWFAAGSIGLGLSGLAVLLGAYAKVHFLMALLH